MKRAIFLLLFGILLGHSGIMAADNISDLKVTAAILGHPDVRMGGSSLRIKLLVQNPTGKPIQFFTESCGWDQNWKEDGNITMAWNCESNMFQIIEIQPGSSFTDESEVFIDERKPGKVTIRFGFSSIGGKQIAWSNKLEILIGPKTSTRKEADEILEQMLWNGGKRTLGPGCHQLPIHHEPT